MTLSRTARILIALLLVAAAAFVWINLFVTAPDSAPVLTRGTPGGAAQAAQLPPGEGDDEEAADGGAVVLPFLDEEMRRSDRPDGDAPADADGADGAAEPGPLADPPTVVTPGESDVVGRDVIVAEFPFLITAPPLEADEEAAEAAAGPGAGRPGSAARATVNPFSPIVLTAPAIPESAEADPPPASPDIVEVDVPDGPSDRQAREAGNGRAQAPAVQAPAPRALAPSSPRSATLPRPLPSGTLPVAPDLLTEPRAEVPPGGPVAVPDVAVREPDAAPESATALRRAPAGVRDGELEPTPLAPGEVAAAAVPERPFVAGSDPLSRYLRDRNVEFTGSVTGSVGVGVFRMNGSPPIVLALGQPLPDTDIVLTDLRGQAAEFTLGDTSHVLNLDLRR